jgi:hypothetical protein
MPLRFGYLADLVDKSERLPEIGKSKRAGEVMCVHHLPLRHLFRQGLKRPAGEGRCSPTAGLASFRG